MSATGQNIADEVRLDLNDGDSNNYRWSDAEFINFINAAQREIVTLVPEANVANGNVEIVAGSGHRQTLPTGGIKFLDVTNYDNTGSEIGPPIRAIERDALDTAIKEWSYESQLSTYKTWPSDETEFTNVRFEHYFHDPRQPKAYFLFPAADPNSSFYVNLTYSAVPTALTALSDSFGLGDEYINAAVIYVRYRCMLKDGRFSMGPEQRKEMWDAFRQALGLKIEADARVRTVRPPEDENG